MRIGIDFGTTHTGAAYLANGRLSFVPLDPANRDPLLLRSMLYITRDHKPFTGLQAVETYLEQETGRLVRFEDKVVGTVENTVARMGRGPMDPDGPIHIIYDVVVTEDVGAHGRLIQSIKTALRDPSYDGTNIFGRYYPVQTLISLLLEETRRRAEAHLDRPVDEVVLGRPVIFSDDPDIDRQAQDRLEDAARLAGFRGIEFVKEPVAAARFYTRTIDRPQVVLVFDFGGGTLDLTVMRAAPQSQPQILATNGVLVGGDDIDSAIMRNKVSRYFGTTATINYEGAPFPYELTNLLEKWQTIPLLSRPKNLTVINNARENGNDADAFKRLETLVLKNYGFLLFTAIEQAKRDLSDRSDTLIQLSREDLALTVPLDRNELPRIIAREIARVQRGITEVLTRAGLDNEAIDVLVTTGGSSLIPIFQTMLKRRFPEASHLRSDTFGSVTAGLALRAAES